MHRFGDLDAGEVGAVGSDVDVEGEGVGLGGDDIFSVTHIANWQVDDVNIDGGAPSASDAFQLSGTAGIDGFNYTANSANGGQIDLTSGGALADAAIIQDLLNKGKLVTD